MESDREKLTRFEEEGDLQGLLDWIRAGPVSMFPPDTMDVLARTIRKLEAGDRRGLVEAAFGEIIGFATLLFIRYRTHAQDSFERQSMLGHQLLDFPYEVEKDGWLQRCERVARFIAEMSSVYSRVQHVGEMVRGKARRKSAPAAWQPLGSDPRENGAGPDAHRPERGRLSKTDFKFP